MKLKLNFFSLFQHTLGCLSAIFCSHTNETNIKCLLLPISFFVLYYLKTWNCVPLGGKFYTVIWSTKGSKHFVPHVLTRKEFWTYLGGSVDIIYWMKKKVNSFFFPNRKSFSAFLIMKTTHSLQKIRIDKKENKNHI